MGRCVAFKCKEVGIYKFPRDNKFKRKWEKAVNYYNTTEHTRICGKHFKETDFETVSKMTGFPLQRKFLKKFVVPSVFSSVSQYGISARSERLQKRNAKNSLLPSTVISANDSKPLPSTSPVTSASSKSLPSTTSETSASSKPLPSTSTTTIPYIVTEVEISMIKEEGITEEVIADKKTKEEGITEEVIADKKTKEEGITEEVIADKKTVNQTTQTSTSVRFFSTNELISDSESVFFYTGLETYEKFKLVFSTLCPMAHCLTYKGSQVEGIGIEDQFLIMLIKLRCNKTNFELSKYFGVSKTVISNIFVTWLNFTYDLWSLIDIWPEKKLIDSYMPTQFKKFHSNTRVVIEGIEISVSKPTNSLSRKATFSSDKNKNTVKFLVGITPGGLFSYCSEGYGGSTPDRQMIEKSDFINKCDSGDSVMAHKGFDVEDLFAKKNISVSYPAFYKGKSQCSGSKAEHKRSLTSRVHIEQLLSLSKTYTILNSDLNPYYIPLASRIFFVCIMLCNFRERVKK